MGGGHASRLQRNPARASDPGCPAPGLPQRSPAPPPIPDFTSCPDLAGAFLFEDLATSCRFEGHRGEFPTYAVKAHGDVRGPRDRKEILPLPLGHWADPGSRLEIEQKGCSKLVLRAYDSGRVSTPYLVYEIDLPDLARHGTLDMSKARLSFEPAGMGRLAIADRDLPDAGRLVALPG